LAAYIVALAKTTSNARTLAGKLSEEGLPSGSDTLQFCSDLLARTGKAPGGGASGKGGGGGGSGKGSGSDRQKAMDVLKRNDSYSMIMDDDDDDDDVAPAVAASAAEVGHKRKNKEAKRDKKRQHTRKKGDEEEEDDAPVRIRRVERHEPQQHAETEEERQERERAEDLEERAAFEERLRARDDEKTRKLVGEGAQAKEARERGEALGAGEGGGASAADRAASYSSYRDLSRQEYLKKREAEEMRRRRDQLEDDDYMFAGVELTEAEKRKAAKDRVVLELADKRASLPDDVERYEMPQAYEDDQGRLDA
jgi:pre-mRNA-splicing factor ATP-dependent RNA helicase DHX16